MSARVCVVCAAYHPGTGGLNRQATLLTERMRDAGLEVFVITRRIPGLPPAEFAPDVEVVRVRSLFPSVIVRDDISLRNVGNSLSYSLGFATKLFARRADYDIVHFHGASIPLFVCLPVLKLLGKKVVAKVASANLGTEAGALSRRYGGLGYLLARWVRMTDAMIAISEEVRGGLREDGFPEGRIHRISNFVDETIFYPLTPAEKAVAKRRLGFDGLDMVVFSGRLVLRKGVDCLLQAWTLVSPRFPAARLVVLGDGDLAADLERTAAGAGSGSTIRFAGRVDNVPDYLRAADVFVLPSLQEGMPNALLEAMASGCPAVATRIGGVVDVVDDGINALLVEPRDADALAGALARLLANPPLRQDLARTALDRIRRDFGLESRVGQYLDLYAALASPPTLPMP